MGLRIPKQRFRKFVKASAHKTGSYFFFGIGEDIDYVVTQNEMEQWDPGLLRFMKRYAEKSSSPVDFEVLSLKFVLRNKEEEWIYLYYNNFSIPKGCYRLFNLIVVPDATEKRAWEKPPLK